MNAKQLTVIAPCGDRKCWESGSEADCATAPTNERTDDMPCYEVRTTSVAFKVEHQDILVKAAKALGWNVRLGGTVIDITPPYNYAMRIDLQTGQATILESQEGKLNQLKVEYTRQTVQTACDQFNWSLEFTDQAQTEGAFVKGVML